MAASSYTGIITFFTFALSVIAAVLAIDMYALLRTGEFGRTWRILIIASVMLALAQALRLANWLDWDAVRQYYLADIAQLAFVIMLGYAFYSQRVLFSKREEARRPGLSIENQPPARRASDFLGEEASPPRAVSVASSAAAEENGDIEGDIEKDGDEDDIEWDAPSATRVASQR